MTHTTTPIDAAAALPGASPDTRAARQGIFARLRAAGPVPPLPRPDLAPWFNGPFARGCEDMPPAPPAIDLGVVAAATEATAATAATAGTAGTAAKAIDAATEAPRWDPDALVAPFSAAARAWRAEVHASTTDDWPTLVRGLLDARGCRRIAIGADSPLQPRLDHALAGLAVRRFDQPIEAWKGELFDQVDAGITAAWVGIADTGSLLLRPGPAEPRTLSLVPPVHIAVLHASRLYPSLAAAVRELRPELDLPTNLVMVSGPSKTADIQQVLAYGAHGPRELLIVVLTDR